MAQEPPHHLKKRKLGIHGDDDDDDVLNILKKIIVHDEQCMVLQRTKHISVFTEQNTSNLNFFTSHLHTKLAVIVSCVNISELLRFNCQPDCLLLLKVTIAVFSCSRGRW